MNRSASGLPSQHTSFNENALIVGTPEEAIDSASALAAWCTPPMALSKETGTWDWTDRIYFLRR